jgi:recombination associated protein RdgC
LGLEYQERIELVLAHDMGIKKIKFTDIVLDQMDDAVIEDEWQLLDSRFTLFSLELRAMLKSLFEVFGTH